MSIKRLFDAVERRGDIGRRVAALVLPIANRPRVTSSCAGKIGLREPGEHTSGPDLASRDNVAHNRTLYDSGNAATGPSRFVESRPGHTPHVRPLRPTRPKSSCFDALLSAFPSAELDEMTRNQIGDLEWRFTVTCLTMYVRVMGDQKFYDIGLSGGQGSVERRDASGDAAMSHGRIVCPLDP